MWEASIIVHINIPEDDDSSGMTLQEYWNAAAEDANEQIGHETFLSAVDDDDAAEMIYNLYMAGALDHQAFEGLDVTVDEIRTQVK